MFSWLSRNGSELHNISGTDMDERRSPISHLRRLTPITKRAFVSMAGFKWDDKAERDLLMAIRLVESQYNAVTMQSWKKIAQVMNMMGYENATDLVFKAPCASEMFTYTALNGDN
ncbi:hypothetical protein NUW58_g4030 [Xylaria curta]|uniref:Uncharacterized protein n=1 Tax=Xylaria curta TaxID=42375 RepID=A0ACC1P874_9PEZI|nr:hypothetical protein NUW58_g4030 [Xylaria curta]